MRNGILFTLILATTSLQNQCKREFNYLCEELNVSFYIVSYFNCIFHVAKIESFSFNRTYAYEMKTLSNNEMWSIHFVFSAAPIFIVFPLPTALMLNFTRDTQDTCDWFPIHIDVALFNFCIRNSLTRWQCLPLRSRTQSIFAAQLFFEWIANKLRQWGRWISHIGTSRRYVTMQYVILLQFNVF